MIKAIAVDDEPPALRLLEHFCGKSGFMELQKTFVKPKEALQYLNDHEIELLFIDINMPSISGVEFVRQLSQEITVIFTTAYSEYAVEGFNLNAVDYLLKPYTYDRFIQAATKAQTQLNHKYNLQKNAPNHIIIRVDYSLINIDTDTILYIESLDNYLKLYLVSNKTIIVRMTMKNILDKLPSSDFVRMHRSFIVSLKHIKSVRNKRIHIADKELPIGNLYEEHFLKIYLRDNNTN